MTHQCFLCISSNAERIVDGSIVEFGERFLGPPARAHGGLAVGALTCPALKRAAESGAAYPMVEYVSGRLSAPVPLTKRLNARVHDGDPMQVELCDGENVVVSGSVRVVDRPVTPGSVIKPPPEELNDHLDQLSQLADLELKGPTVVQQYLQFSKARGLEKQIDVPCFGCSEKSHALKLKNRVSDQGDLWTRWVTEPHFLDAPGQLATSMVTAALDCSNLWVLMAREPELSLRMRLEEKKIWITGTHSVNFIRVPSIDDDYRVVTRFLRREGRKGFTMAVLLNRKGTVFAVAEAISILIDVPQEMQFT